MLLDKCYVPASYCNRTLSTHTNPATPEGNLTALALFVLSSLELLKLCQRICCCGINSKVNCFKNAFFLWLNKLELHASIQNLHKIYKKLIKWVTLSDNADAYPSPCCNR